MSEMVSQLPASWLVDFVRGLRPAPIGLLAARLCGLSKRRIVTTAEGKFLVSPVSHLGYQLIRGDYEPSTTAAIRHFMAPGATFIDLGANEGYFSVIASALAGREGKIVAVEPQSRLESVVQANFALNGCHNARLVRGVVSDRNGTMKLHLAPGLSTGGSSLFRATRYPLPTEEVPSYTLAQFLQTTGVEYCDLMKVDIEGAEYEVFMNAGDVLRSGRIRMIILAIHDSQLAHRGLSGAQLYEWMEKCGYRIEDRFGVWIHHSARN